MFFISASWEHDHANPENWNFAFFFLGGGGGGGGSGVFLSPHLGNMTMQTQRIGILHTCHFIHS